MKKELMFFVIPAAATMPAVVLGMERAYFFLAQINNVSSKKTPARTPRTLSLPDMTFSTPDLIQQFCTAVAYGREKDIDIMLQQKLVNPDDQDMYGNTALWYAARYNQPHIIPVLCAKGANPNMANQWGLTPLAIACRKGYVDVVKQLLNRGVLVNVTDECGRAPLHEVCAQDDTKYKNYDEEIYDTIASLLCNAKAEIRKDKQGCTPLHIACDKGNNLIVRRLLQEQASINAVDNNLKTPLHYACRNGRIEVVRELLTHPLLNKYKKDNSGNMPCDAAIAWQAEVKICNIFWGNEEDKQWVEIIQQLK